jgi:hypothetical protein
MVIISIILSLLLHKQEYTKNEFEQIYTDNHHVSTAPKCFDD